MQLRPADFFTSNPALDVPSKRNEASVLVQCCDGRSTDAGNSGRTAEQHEGGKSVQANPLSHLQGTTDGINAEKAGANVEVSKSGANEPSTGRRLSRALTDLVKKIRE